jgi:NCS1 family nucleobase:cation symporter-1
VANQGEDIAVTIEGASPDLYNEDLAPAKVRNWGPFSIFNVWTSDVHSLWGYYLAASLFLFCGGFVNFIIAIGIGSLIIYALMNMVGYAGVKTGVPYPVLARASFGIWGANIPALVRAIVACFWYGAQTAAASGAIVALLTRLQWFDEFNKTSHLLGHSTLEVICFVIIWALQLLIIQKGMETVRRFQDWAGPAVWVMMLLLAIYLCVKSGSFAFTSDIPMDVLREKTADAGIPGDPGSWTALFGVAAIWVTYFSALYLNFCDFARYAPDKAALRKGNIWGLPVNLILFSLVAGVTTIAAYDVYHEVLLHPDQISAKFDSWFLAALAALTFAVATLGINVVANFVSPAFDFSNVFPRQIDFKKGGDLWRDDGRLLPDPEGRGRRRGAVPREWRVPLPGRLACQCLHRRRHRRSLLLDPAELHQLAAVLVGCLWLVLRRRHRRHHLLRAAHCRCRCRSENGKGLNKGIRQ